MLLEVDVCTAKMKNWQVQCISVSLMRPICDCRMTGSESLSKTAAIMGCYLPAMVSNGINPKWMEQRRTGDSVHVGRGY